MDPVILAAGGWTVGFLAAKSIRKFFFGTEEKTTQVEISYYSTDGVRETKKIKATKKDGEVFDEFGFRVGYSAHYTRMKEIENNGFGLTPCDCEICMEAEREVQRKEDERERLLRELERKTAENIARKKRAAEIKAQGEKAIRSFHEGELDHLSPRHLSRMNIPVEDIIERVGGPIVWADYAISGTKEVNYEKTHTGEGIEDIRYYEVHRTFYPNGQLDLKRIQINQDQFESAKGFNRTPKPLITSNTSDIISKRLMNNKIVNDKYIEHLKTRAYR